MFERENAIGLVLLVLCAAVAVVLLYSIGSGTRFHYEGPSWLATALMILFLAAGLYSFISRPGRRWPWQRDREDRPPDG
jgi:hypothetical protein